MFACLVECFLSQRSRQPIPVALCLENPPAVGLEIFLTRGFLFLILVFVGPPPVRFRTGFVLRVRRLAAHRMARGLALRKGTLAIYLWAWCNQGVPSPSLVGSAVS